MWFSSHYVTMSSSQAFNLIPMRESVRRVSALFQVKSFNLSRSPVKLVSSTDSAPESE